MVGTGSDKTRLARGLLGQIRTRTKVPCVIFDFTGDLAGSPAFVGDVGAAVVAAPNSPFRWMSRTSRTWDERRERRLASATRSGESRSAGPVPCS